MSDHEQEFSTDEDAGGTPWERVSSFELPFGIFKGLTLQQMIKTKRKRDYMKYLLTWDLLHDSTRTAILTAFEHYESLKSNIRSTSGEATPIV